MRRRATFGAEIYFQLIGPSFVEFSFSYMRAHRRRSYSGFMASALHTQVNGKMLSQIQKAAITIQGY